MPTRVNCSFVDGLMPNEKIARIKGADGRLEEVEVSTLNIENNKLLAFVVGKRGEDVLIELPRESTSGRWRMWVNQSLVGA